MPSNSLADLFCPDLGRRLYGRCDALYERLLTGFAGDPCVSRLCDALRAGRMDDAFLQAHTLKGLCAQLALPALQLHADALCDLLRGGDPAALPAARALLPALLNVYRDTLRVIALHPRD